MIGSAPHANIDRALLELHKQRLMYVTTHYDFDAVAESSLAAIEMVVNITCEIVGMDDVFDVRRMPLAAVILLQKVGSMMVWIERYYNRKSRDMQPIIESLERAGKQWIVAGKLLFNM